MYRTLQIESLLTFYTINVQQKCMHACMYACIRLYKRTFQNKIKEHVLPTLTEHGNIQNHLFQALFFKAPPEFSKSV